MKACRKSGFPVVWFFVLILHAFSKNAIAQEVSSSRSAERSYEDTLSSEVVLLSLSDEPPLKNETARPIEITPVESENGQLPEEVVLPTPLPVRRTEMSPTDETAPPRSVSPPREALREPPTEPTAFPQDHHAGEETDKEITQNLFLDEVRSRIEDEKQYPWIARLKGIEGETRIRFLIRPSGEVDQVRIVHSSGWARLDKAAITLVKNVGRFPEPPKVWTEGVEINVSLVYRLKTGG